MLTLLSEKQFRQEHRFQKRERLRPSALQAHRADSGLEVFISRQRKQQRHSLLHLTDVANCDQPIPNKTTRPGHELKRLRPGQDSSDKLTITGQGRTIPVSGMRLSVSLDSPKRDFKKLITMHDMSFFLDLKLRLPPCVPALPVLQMASFISGPQLLRALFGSTSQPE